VEQAHQLEFDYVIVGAGSAGCVLASRLTEDANVKVALVEAGGWDRNPWLRIPLAWPRVLLKRMNDWMYFSEPDASLDNRSIECARQGHRRLRRAPHARGDIRYPRGNRGTLSISDIDGVVTSRSR